MVILLGIVVLVVLVIGISIYNGLINRKNQVANSFGAIDAFLKKRYDLIPNLVAACQQYMQFEKTTLTQITELRTKAMSGNVSDDEKVDINNKLTKMLGSVMVAVENYPDLKSSQNFLQLQGALNEIEEQLSAARRAYNAAVTDYNNAVEMFPSSIFAGMMNYKLKTVFEIPEAERANVNVGELFKK